VAIKIVVQGRRRVFYPKS